MQEIRSSKPPVVTGICDPNKSRARHHRSNCYIVTTTFCETCMRNLDEINCIFIMFYFKVFLKLPITHVPVYYL